MSESQDIAEMLDDDSNPLHKELEAILVGNSTAREFDFDALESHFKTYNKAFLQNVATDLLPGKSAGAVIDVLLKKLEILERWWFPTAVAIRPGPLRKRGLTAINTRAMDVSAWILALPLPILPSIAWRRVEDIRESVNQLSRYRLPSTRVKNRVFGNLRRVIATIRNAKPYRFQSRAASETGKEALPRRAVRAKRGETPIYILEAIELLKKSMGRLSTREIARRLERDHSLIRKHPLYRAAMAQYKAEYSSLHEESRATAKGGATTRDVLRPSESPGE